MKTRLFFLILAIALGTYLTAHAAATQDQATPRKLPSTLFYGGEILTMDGAEPAYAEAVVAREGQIIFVGGKKEALARFGSTAKKVDLGGKTMLPGFIDPHGHFMSAVMMVNQVNVAAPPFGTATNIPQIITKLKTFQQEKKTGTGTPRSPGRLWPNWPVPWLKTISRSSSTPMVMRQSMTQFSRSKRLASRPPPTSDR